MNSNPLPANFVQAPLFQMGDDSTGTLELIPVVWTAAEALTNPEPKVRLSGLERLVSLNAHRLSPLIAYLVADLLVDPDLSIRTKAVRALASVLRPDAKGQTAPESVRKHLIHTLARMRVRNIFALLQVVESDPGLEPQVIDLLSTTPYAGNHLVEILMNRKLALEIRRQAVRTIGQVGYLVALPALERMAVRLVARMSGQQAMPFAPPGDEDETALLPAVQQALALLQAP